MGRNNTIPTTNVLLVIVLSAITLGIYIPIWFLRRRDWLDHLSAHESLSSGAAVFLLILFSISAAFFPIVILSTDPSLVSGLDMIDNLISLIGSITILVLAFKVRRILHEHFNVTHKLGVYFSGVFTFLFTIFYLQYKINQLAEMQEAVEGLRQERDILYLSLGRG